MTDANIPKDIHDAQTQRKSQSAVIAWAASAKSLAHWAMEHLVNRTDAWGSYLPAEQRTPKQKVVTRTGELNAEIVAKHFVGADVGDIIGLHTTAADNTCRWVAVDIDHHGARDDVLHRRNRNSAIKLYQRARELGFAPILVSSNGYGGYHLFILFEAPLPAPRAYALAAWLVRDWHDLGFIAPPEAFPKQPLLTTTTKYGNWLRLPGRHHTLAYHSQVWTGEHWASGEEAIRVILATAGKSTDLVPPEAWAYDPDAATTTSLTATSPAEASTPKTPLPRNAPSPRQRPNHTLSIPRHARPLANVLERLDNVLTSGDQWSARCPAHKDRANSLSVAEGDDGRVLLHCHAGCGVEKIVDAMELMMRDLFDHRVRCRPLRYTQTEK